MLDLPATEVHVWVVPAALARRCEPLLGEAERARAARLRVEHAREAYVAAHGALRLLLAAYVGADPGALRFGEAEGGKPFLLTPSSSVSFNLSHTQGAAALAFAAERAVGVDVERLHPLTAEAGVARRIMTPAELARYEAMGAGERGHFVLWVWARKEALIKATGEGLRADLRARACEPDPASSTWSVVDLDVPGCAAAVAARGWDWSPVVRRLEL